MNTACPTCTCRSSAPPKGRPTRRRSGTLEALLRIYERISKRRRRSTSWRNDRDGEVRPARCLLCKTDRHLPPQSLAAELNKRLGIRVAKLFCVRWCEASLRERASTTASSTDLFGDSD